MRTNSLRYAIICLLLNCFCVIYAADVDVQDVIDAGLPVLYVETVEGETPTYETVSHPEGMLGVGITNATKVPGQVKIVQNGATLYDSGEYVAKTSGMTIKVRGNTSAYADKKPYKIKLQKKADMLCRGDEKKYADKNWLLIKEPILRNMVAFKVNELLGLQWTPAFRYVNVMFNGEYHGLYMLVEAVERNTGCRLNVSSTGYIYELDAYWWNEDRYFDSTFATEFNYTYKYPDSDDVTEEQNDYIQSYVASLEQSLIDGTYEDYIDLNSFASWMLAHDILSTKDAGGSNMFFTKYDNTDDSKVMMGNIWDFDSTMGMPTMLNQWANVHNMFCFQSLFNSKNKAFVRAYKEKWNEVSQTLFSDIPSYLDEFASSEDGLAFDKSIKLDDKRWGTTSFSVANSVQYAKNWFSQRKEWLSVNIPMLADVDEISAVRGVKGGGNRTETMYNLSGQKVSGAGKGLFIGNVDGKTVKVMK